MDTTVTSKACEICGGMFSKPSKYSWQQWKFRRYCSYKCWIESPEGREARVRGGKIGGNKTGKINGKKNVESGHMDWLHRTYGPAQGKWLGEKYGPIQGKKNVESGLLQKIHPLAVSASSQWTKTHPQQASERGRKGGTIIMKRPGWASHLGRLGGSASIKKLTIWVKNNPDLVGESSRKNIIKAIKAQKPRPTNLEQRLFALFLYYGLPFDFVGNERKNSIGGKYPDFINDKLKMIVEVSNKSEKYFRYKIAWKQYEQERIQHFSKYGYTCIVVWDDMDDEDMILIVGAALRKLELAN